MSMKKAELQKANEELYKITLSLNRQVDYLLSELIFLNQGCGVRPHWYTKEHEWKYAMMHKAGLAIEKLHEMRKNK